MELNGILENLVSEVIVAAVAIGLGYWLLRRQNTGLAKLLGARKKHRIVIVLPDMRIKAGGTEGAYRQVGYVGPAVTRLEFEAAVALRDALADPLARLLGRRHLFRSAGKVGESGPVESTEMCPPEDKLKAAIDSGSLSRLPSELADRSLVLLGGLIYNKLADLALRHPSCLMAPELPPGGEWGIRIKAGPRQGEFFPGRDPKTSRELALIQSLPVDSSDGPTITVCAGSGEVATLASVSFLLANWRRIARNANGKPYAVLLYVDMTAGTARWMEAVSDGKAFNL